MNGIICMQTICVALNIDSFLSQFFSLSAIEEQTKRRIFDHAPDSHTTSSQHHHHHNSSSPSSTGPRYKSFDAGPRSKSFERDYMSAESGATWERRASFSVAPGASASGSAYVVPAAAPSLLQSIYTWWGAAPLPTPALLSEREDSSVSSAKEVNAISAAVPSSSAAASTPVPVFSNNVEAARASTPPSNTTGLHSAHSSTASMASTPDTAENASSLKSQASSVPASPARAPVNKIAERLQKIRVQKQPPT